MSMKKKLSLFVDGDGVIKASVVDVGADGVHGVSIFRAISVGESCFYISGTMARGEYEMWGEPLELTESGYIKFGGRQLVASLGEEAAAHRIALIVDTTGGLSRPAWRGVFRELSVQRAVSMAVADPRLAPHLSPEAAVVYAAEHSDLVESGWLL